MVAEFWFAVAIAGIQWNVVVAVFNLFPILPLDGGRIVTALLPGRLSYSYSRLEPYGMPILIGFIVLLAVYQPLGQLFAAVMGAGNNFFYALFGIE